MSFFHFKQEIPLHNGLTAVKSKTYQIVQITTHTLNILHVRETTVTFSLQPQPPIPVILEIAMSFWCTRM